MFQRLKFASNLQPIQIICLYFSVNFVFGTLMLLVIRWQFPEGDLFFQISLISLLMALFGLIFMLKINTDSKWERLCRLLTVFLSSLVFFSGFQMTLLNIDRSRSFYVIGWAQSGNLCTNKQGLDLQKIRSREVLNTEAVEQRIAEQIQRNLITLDQRGCFEITNQGEMYFEVSEFLASVFSLGGWQKNKA